MCCYRIYLDVTCSPSSFTISSYVDLHKEHLQSFVVGHPESTAQPEEAFEHRLIEEELTLQINLLKEQMKTSSTLFPEGEAEDAVEETLHLKPTLEEKAKPTLASSIVEGETALMSIDEETMETALFCLVIGALTLGLLQL